MPRSRAGTLLLLASAVLLPLAVATTRVQAASTETVPNHPALNDRFVFELGGFYSRSATQVGLSGPSGGAGVAVDLESAFGLNERNLTPIAGFMWRFGERWRLEMEYFAINRTATRTLASDVTWGDQVFPTGATVNSKYDFKDYRVGVGYSFFKRPDKELGIGLGVHVLRFDVSAESAGIGADGGDVTAPLPVVSIYGAFALTNEWALRVRWDWLSLSYSNYSGSIQNAAIDVLCQPFRHVGFGLGLRSLAVNAQIDKEDWRGAARTVYTGPSAYVTVSF